MTANNAELGYKIAVSKKPDLILMDINLPGMNGYEALKQLQETEETGGIPVIAVTAEAFPNNLETGIRGLHYETD